jgi:hypothetical protein
MEHLNTSFAGAGLPAMAAGQAPDGVNVPTPSLASQLPQDYL